MSYTQYTTDGAVARSIEHKELVTVVVPTSSDLIKACVSILIDPIVEDCDPGANYYITLTINKYAMKVHLWGTDIDGNIWRVHITHID